MKIKALFPDHKIPFVSVKKILSRWYPKDTIVSVEYRASGITIDMSLSMFYESVDQLAITNKVFGIRFDDRFFLVDAELLEFTQVTSDDVIMKIWRKPRKSRLRFATIKWVEDLEDESPNINDEEVTTKGESLKH